MSNFIPAGYVSHIKAWSVAYLSIYGPMADDDWLKEQRKVQTDRDAEISKAAIRAKSVNIKRAQKQITNEPGPSEYERRNRQDMDHLKKYAESAKQKAIDPRWLEPEAYLFGGSLGQGHLDRLIKTRDALLSALVQGEITGYTPVVLSASAISFHQMLKMRLPEPIEPFPQLGIWATSEGNQALTTGELAWAFSTYDTKQMRPLFFKQSELIAAFPPKAAVTDMTGLSPKVIRGIPIYENKWPEGHRAAGVQTDQLAIHLLGDDGFSIGADNFRILKAECERRRQGSEQ